MSRLHQNRRFAGPGGPSADPGRATTTARSASRLRRAKGALLLAALGALLLPSDGASQEARRRWERQCQIRAEKFDLVLPQAMRANGIDMWITVMREGLHDPLYEALGRGYQVRASWNRATRPGEAWTSK